MLGDFNSHLGVHRIGFEECTGKFGYGLQNKEGKDLLEVCAGAGWKIVNTWFDKRESHRVTYKSGGRFSQIDLIIIKGCDWKFVKDCKVIPSETVATQHKPVVAQIEVQKFEKKIVKIHLNRDDYLSEVMNNTGLQINIFS